MGVTAYRAMQDFVYEPESAIPYFTGTGEVPLTGLLEHVYATGGVRGAILADSSGRTVAYLSRTLADLVLLGRIARSALLTLRELALPEDDWEHVAGEFSEGHLLIVNLAGANRVRSEGLTLCVVTRGQLASAAALTAVHACAADLRSQPLK